MKALFLRTDYYGALNVGGSFSHTLGFLSGLQKIGHQCCVVSSGDLPLDPSVPFYKVPYSQLYRNLPEVLSIAYNRTLIPAASRIIERERPDFLYHRHSEFNYSSAVLASKFGLPLILECNGSEVWIKKHWGRVFFERILRRAEEIQFTVADAITVVSEVMKSDLIRLGVHEKKILVNPNGVDPDRFRPDINGTEIRTRYGLEGKIVAGFVGTFGAWHGVEVLARAIKPTVHKNKNVHFLIVGDGALRSEVERIIREDNVENSVTLTGSIFHEEIPGYLAACDMLLSPHVHNADGTPFFGSPTKLFEYMAMAKPVIACSVGQIGEVIRDGINGLVMRERDHNDLAEKILMLSTDTALCEKFGAAARNTVVRNYTWEQNARRVVETAQAAMKR